MFGASSFCLLEHLVCVVRMGIHASRGIEVTLSYTTGCSLCVRHQSAHKPAVSMPRDSGATSSKSMLETFKHANAHDTRHMKLKEHNRAFVLHAESNQEMLEASPHKTKGNPLGYMMNICSTLFGAVDTQDHQETNTSMAFEQ
eukprot:1548821-Amphidinium_carterae.3